MRLSRLSPMFFALLISTASAAGTATDTPHKTREATTQPVAALTDNTSTTTTETIVFLRHGEKAAGGLGQLSPQGFNRALALIRLLPEKYGKPDFLFAPNPGTTQMREGDGKYDYVRALATIEPLAIQLAMPVRTPCGFSQIDLLNAELTHPTYANSTLYVAWEHAAAEKAVTKLLQQFGGDVATVPHWSGSDYDSLYVIKITRAPGAPGKVQFIYGHEGLDQLSKSMPLPAHMSAP